jgi:hypothetical protein
MIYSSMTYQYLGGDGGGGVGNKDVYFQDRIFIVNDG